MPESTPPSRPPRGSRGLRAARASAKLAALATLALALSAAARDGLPAAVPPATVPPATVPPAAAPPAASAASPANPEVLPPIDGGTSLLVVAPHPDDETLCCAGVIQRVLRAGGRVSVAWITSGDASEL